MKIYITEIETADREEFLDKALPLLSEERRKKTGTFFTKEEKVTSAAAELLLGFAIDEYLMGKKDPNGQHEEQGVRLRPVTWRKLVSGDLDLPYTMAYGEHGKPYFTEEGAPEFNISHSGNVITLVINDKPSGIDIEKRRDVSDALIKKAFSQNDAKWIYNGKNDEEIRIRFLRAWTIKEAYHKMLGESVFSGKGPEDIFDLATGELSEKIISDCKVVEEMYDRYIITVISRR